MLGQTFAPNDLLSVLTLVLLEALLSADNALVLAIMVRHLDEAERRRALLYGLGGAFAFRLVAIVFASFVLGQWWLQAIGGGYLLFLAVHHLVPSRSNGAREKTAKARGFWPTVVAVELTDVAFALDSVLASIAFITQRDARGMPDVREDKIWVVIVGAMIGIVLLRFAAAVFSRLLDRYPSLNVVAYVLVGWVGLKLVSHAFHSAHGRGVVPFSPPAMSEPVFWGGLGAILVLGVALTVVRRAPHRPSERSAE